MTAVDRIRDHCSDLEATIFTVNGEAANESLEGQIAVAQCIRNRVLDPQKRFGSSWRSVCFRRAQFSCWIVGGGMKNFTRTVEFAEQQLALSADKRSAEYREFEYVVVGVMTNRWRDRVRGANHYVTAELYQRKPPYWTVGETPVARVDRHVFFQL